MNGQEEYEKARELLNGAPHSNNPSRAYAAAEAWALTGLLAAFLQVAEETRDPE